jgi:plasmid stability protein
MIAWFQQYIRGDYSMASVTIKNIPDELLGSLLAHAAAAKRSMNRDVIYLLEVALTAQNSPRFQS